VIRLNYVVVNFAFFVLLVFSSVVIQTHASWWWRSLHRRHAKHNGDLERRRDAVCSTSRWIKTAGWCRHRIQEADEIYQRHCNCAALDFRSIKSPLSCCCWKFNWMTLGLRMEAYYCYPEELCCGKRRNETACGKWPCISLYYVKRTQSVSSRAG